MRGMGRDVIGLIVVGGMLVGGVASAEAQVLQPWTERGFVNVSGGSQTAPRAHSVNGSEVIYEEEATWGGGFGVGRAGIFDIAGGARVWSNLAVGIGFSRYRDSATATVVATIPDPVIFDAPHTSDLIVAGLAHRERAVHLSAVWMLPVTGKIDVALMAGPSFFSLTKGVVTDVTITPGGSTLDSAATATITRSATGGHFAVDVRYRILRNIGAGVFLRYGAASVGAPEVNEGTINLGGFNYGAGVRLRF